MFIIPLANVFRQLIIVNKKIKNTRRDEACPSEHAVRLCTWTPCMQASRVRSEKQGRGQVQ
jgi:hypothetical protein